CAHLLILFFSFFFQAEDGIRDATVTGVQTCALPIYVDFNSRVHKGDIVALIDPALFQGALLQASADLDNAKANLVAAKANLEKRSEERRVGKECRYGWWA